MRALTVVVLVAVASMLVIGCGPKKEELPPLEPAEGQPAAIAPGAGAAKAPVAVETMPPPPVAKPRPLTPVRAPAESAPPADAAAGQSYTVKAGDTLYTLAKRFYGDGKLWTKIADANKDKIKDTSRIPIGTALTIPPK